MVKRQSVLQAGNVIAAIATIIINSLAAVGWINNTTTSAISDKYPSLFTPAGITFSIWGVIYLLMLIFIVVQLKGIRKGDQPDYISTISVYFILSCLANILWIFIWQYNYITWTLVPMVLLLLCLIEVYTRLGVGKKDVPKRERYGVHLLFSVYLGWITVATVANVAAYLVAINWNRFGVSEVTWFGVILTIATIIGILVIWTRKDLAYMLVLAWAFLGIIIKHLTSSTVQPLLAAYTAVMIVILIFAYIIRLVASRTAPTKTQEETPASTPPTEEPPATPPSEETPPTV
jgi:hypothetical protein